MDDTPYISWPAGSGSFLSGVGGLPPGIVDMLPKKLSSVTLPWNAESHQRATFLCIFTIRDSWHFMQEMLMMKELTCHCPITCCLGKPLNAGACQCLYESKWWLRFYLHNTHQSTYHGCNVPCCLGDDLICVCLPEGRPWGQTNILCSL